MITCTICAGLKKDEGVAPVAYQNRSIDILHATIAELRRQQTDRDSQITFLCNQLKDADRSVRILCSARDNHIARLEKENRELKNELILLRCEIYNLKEELNA